jgi:hypothetical protein
MLRRVIVRRPQARSINVVLTIKIDAVVTINCGPHDARRMGDYIEWSDAFRFATGCEGTAWKSVIRIGRSRESMS